MVSRRRVQAARKQAAAREGRGAACAPGSPLMRQLLEEALEAVERFARPPDALLASARSAATALQAGRRNAAASAYCPMPARAIS